ncbi:dispanin subfamily A member 2b-like [Channa argus]|uniref:dispanin subfamily A member 2b-like n=1 Tax=Channa argus TaxID=215402 RepID=UPI0035200E12
MNPADHTVGPVPLETGKYEKFSGEPEATVVVTISTEPVKDHTIWSLFSFVYANIFCLGLAAFIYSIKARDRKVAGDMNGARRYGSTARCLNIWATVLASIILLITIILFSMGDFKKQLEIGNRM